MPEHVDSDAGGPSPTLAEHFDQLRRGERQAVLTRVASSLAHALGTPLNVIAGRAALAQMAGASEGEIAENCQIITRQVRAITALLQEVLSFARAGWPAPQPVELRVMLEEARELMQPIAAARGAELSVERVADLTLPLHREAVLQVLTALISFGLTLPERVPLIRLSAERAHAEPPSAERGRVQAGDYAHFRVTFDGERIDERLFEHVYEPWLHRSDTDRDGALCLAIAFGMAREHRGWVEHRAGESGSSLELHWPLSAT